MKIEELTPDSRETAIRWLKIRCGLAAGGMFPATGLAVRGSDGTLKAALFVLFEKTSPVAYLGTLVANPDNRPSESGAAVDALLPELEDYAGRNGVRWIFTLAANRAINRKLDRRGYLPGDNNVEQKIKYVR